MGRRSVVKSQALTPATAAKVNAMMGQVVQMTKLDMKKLEKAHQEG